MTGATISDDEAVSIDDTGIRLSIADNYGVALGTNSGSVSNIFYNKPQSRFGNAFRTRPPLDSAEPPFEAGSAARVPEDGGIVDMFFRPSSDLPLKREPRPLKCILQRGSANFIKRSILPGFFHDKQRIHQPVGQSDRPPKIEYTINCTLSIPHYSIIATVDFVILDDSSAAADITLRDWPDGFVVRPGRSRAARLTREVIIAPVNSSPALESAKGHVLFCLYRGGRLRHFQVDTDGASEQTFFSDLKEQVQRGRGWLRRCISPLTFDCCEFARFDHYEAGRIAYLGPLFPPTPDPQYECHLAEGDAKPLDDEQWAHYYRKPARAVRWGIEQPILKKLPRRRQRLDLALAPGDGAYVLGLFVRFKLHLWTVTAYWATLVLPLWALVFWWFREHYGEWSVALGPLLLVASSTTLTMEFAKPNAHAIWTYL